MLSVDSDWGPTLVDKFIGWFASVLEFDELRSWYLHANLIVIHPDYSRDELWHNDIALLRLEEPVPVSATHIPEIQAAKLPKQGETRFPMDGQNCIMKGWGCTMNGGIVSSIAREVELPKVSDSDCTRYWSVNTIDRLCAGYNLAAMGICSGDSGGPLVCQNRDLDWIQVGIASFTSANNPGNVPGVFTRVSNYVTWIEDTINMYTVYD
ncbi:hypothetical protein LSH36_397g02016 [Paralvinella palmiformis]|uniref:Peptidase S1 domain-containing protein n=1 Tax=Paralvinella palmiformis TaxID=53620 RepID=A0AAD9JDC9_9ANNE|nr:hypothetical protein LSH36_397g02016 [Paralvinella palmiformis]